MSSAPVPHLGAVTAPRRFPDEITAVLLQRIEAGAYPPGSKLPSTRELAEAFHVSPPMVREALSRLKHDGVVEPRQGSGVYVRARRAALSLRLGVQDDPSLKVLADTYEMRLHVEQSCAELAAQRRTAADLKRLRAALDQMALAVRTRSDGTEADVRFHLGIAEATRNQAMRRLVEFLHGSLNDSVRRARSNSERTPGHPEAVQAEHEAIFAAVEAADPVRARAAVQEHLVRAAERLGLRIGNSSAASAPRAASRR
ncbi:FadR/GntR family transcriptional regulator [Pseudorhodoferax sp.]|uniref:FadR/GntR family transcriptional regulator n=1 Tax=Pseudorhodoferax sp. TaxID=1993553 RepID=UPI002DD69ECC|nr:FadR/GntR family transcriptional regulator [Pseudorhodoferax sp.]